MNTIKIYTISFLLLSNVLFGLDFNLPQGIPTTYVNTREQFNQIDPVQKDALQYLKTASKTAHTVRFIFVRHGQTASNAIGGLPGSRTSGDPLTEEGIKQSLQVGKDLSETQLLFDAIYLSPTTRTRQTLEKMNQKIASSISFIEDERLHEKYHGRYEQFGPLTGDELAKVQKDYLVLKEKEIKENTGPQKPFLDKFTFSPDPAEVESLQNIYDRVTNFIHETYETSKDSGANILVISHSGVLKTLFMQEAYKMGYDIDYRSFEMQNGGILVIEVDELGMRVVASQGLSLKSP